MNRIAEAWEAAKGGKITEFSMGGFQFTPAENKFEVQKTKGEFTQSDFKRLQANLEKSTQRRWASMGLRADHKAHFWLVPEVNAPWPTGEPVQPGLIIPTKDNLETAEIHCHRHNFEICRIPLPSTGDHHDRPCRYGSCPECGKTMLSFIK